MDGWIITGVIVGIVTLALIVWQLCLSLFERAERKRSLRRGSLSLSHVSDRRDAAGVLLDHRLRLGNDGASAVTIQWSALVNAEPVLVDNPLVPKTLPPFSSHEFAVKSPNLASAWLLVLFSDAADVRWVCAAWMPAEAAGSISDEFYRQIREQPRRLRRAMRHAGAIGPGGDPVGMAKTTKPNDARLPLWIEEAIRLAGPPPYARIHA